MKINFFNIIKDHMLHDIVYAILLDREMKFLK